MPNLQTEDSVRTITLSHVNAFFRNRIFL